MKAFYINGDTCKELTPNFKLTHDQEVKLIQLGITALVLYKTCGGSYLYAYDGISRSVQPLIDVLVDLAEPVSYGFMVKGCLEWMSGKEHEGKKTMKSSITGFLGIQFIPQIFKIIRSIKIN